MRSVPFALTWELLYCGRWTLLLGLVGGLALPVILLTSIRIATGPNADHPTKFMVFNPYSNSNRTGKYLESDEPSEVEKELMIQLSLVQVALIQVNIFVFGASVVASLRSVKRLYPYPLSTNAIVCSQLLLGASVMAVHSGLSIAFLNRVFSVNWPILGPSLFAAVSFMAILSMIWQTDNGGWLALGICVIAGVMGTWLNARYSIFSPPTRSWDMITPFQVATLLGFGALAFYFAITGVARNRRGGQLPALGIVALLERSYYSPPVDGPAFKSRMEAQAWFDWRSKGWPMPASVMAAIVFGAAAWLIGSRDPRVLLVGCVMGGLIISMLSMVAAMILGNVGPNDGSYDMGHFLATRPLTSSELARSLLTTAMKSVLFAWILWLCALVFVYGTLRSSGVLPSYLSIREWLGKEYPDRLLIYSENGKTFYRWFVLPLTLLGPWIVVGLGMSVGSTGRIKTFAALFFSAMLLFIAATQFSQFALPMDVRTLVAERCLMAGGVLLVAGSAFVFIAARRRSLVSWTTTYTSLAVWGVLSSVVLIVRSQAEPKDLWINIVAVGLAALAVVPFGAVPLGIAMNRTR